MHPGSQVTTEFWILSQELHVTLLAPRILMWLIDFLKICGALYQ